MPVFQIRKPALMRDSRLPGTGGSTSRRCVSGSQGQKIWLSRRFGPLCVLSGVPFVPRPMHGTQEDPAGCSTQYMDGFWSSDHSTCYFQPERAWRPGVRSSQGARARACFAPAAHGGSGLAPRGAAPDGGTEAGGARTQLPVPKSVLRVVMKSEQERQSRPGPGRAPIRKMPQEGGCPPAPSLGPRLAAQSKPEQARMAHPPAQGRCVPSPLVPMTPDCGTKTWTQSS